MRENPIDHRLPGSFILDQQIEEERQKQNIPIQRRESNTKR